MLLGLRSQGGDSFQRARDGVCWKFGEVGLPFERCNDNNIIVGCLQLLGRSAGTDSPSRALTILI